MKSKTLKEEAFGEDIYFPFLWTDKDPQAEIFKRTFIFLNNFLAFLCFLLSKVSK